MFLDLATKRRKEIRMKNKIILSLCYVGLFLILPLLISRTGGMEISLVPYTEAAEAAWGDTVKVFNHKTGKISVMSSFDYIVGVIAAEVPATYDKEAIKANAVAAYTYAMRKKEYKEEHPDYAAEAHKGAHVCTDYAHCKSYKSESEQRDSWGDKYDEYYAYVSECVREVYGKTLVYKGEPALTVFHSISAGKSASCADIWGNAVPYLQSVDSSWDIEEKGYMTTATFSEEQVKKILSGVKLPTEAKEWLEVTERAESGYVKKVSAGDGSFTGGEIRKMFSLRSNCFEISYNEEEKSFVFTVKGYGHGVGMSQSGSQAMALEGNDYKAILAHYYPGTELVDRYAPSEATE